MRTFLSRSLTCLALVSGIIAGGFSPVAAQAADGTWSLANSGNWATSGNWTGSNVPGTISGTTNTDTAVFDQVLSSVRTITVDTNRNLQNITFGAGNTGNAGYSLTGTTLLLTSGGTILMQGSTGSQKTTISSGIVVEGDGGNYTIQNDSTPSDRTLTISIPTPGASAIVGTSSLGNTTTVTLAGSNTGTNLMGAITNGTNGGKVAVVKTGAGSWYLQNGNPFTGGMTINGGTVYTLTNLASGLGNGALNLSGGGTVEMVGGGLNNINAINVDGDATIRNGGAGAGNEKDFGGAIALTAGSSLTISNGAGVTSGTAAVGVNGLNTAGDATITVNNTSVSGTTVVSRLFLSGASNVGGTLTVMGSGQIFNNTSAISGFGSLTLDSTFTGTFISDSNLAYQGDTEVDGGTLQLGTGNFGGGYAATSSLTDNGTVVWNKRNGAATVNAGISGTGNLLVTDTDLGHPFVSNDLTLNAVNNISGTTTVTDGRILLNGGGKLANSAIVLTGSNAGFDISTITAVSSTIKSLSGGIGSKVNLGGKTLAINNTLATNYSGTILGTGGINKTNSGTMTLSGLNTYTGTTTVSAGTLLLASGGVIGNGGVAVNGGEFKINGSTTSAVNVASGAKISGSGTTGNLTVASGGTVGPGNSPGILSTGDFSLTSGANYAADITGAGTSVAGVDNDMLNVTGAVTLGGNLNLNLAGFTRVYGTLYFLINNDGADAIIAAFANINGGSTSNSTMFSLGGDLWFISYSANYNGGVGSTFTGGNDLALEAVPEPQTWALGLGGIGAVLLFRRRRLAAC